MIRTVIFDLGKVLLDYEWERYLDSFGFDEKTWKIVADAVFRSDAWEAGDAGVSPDEQLKMFIANAPAYEKEIRMVQKSEGNCISLAPYAMDLIAHFREQGCNIFYLSNYSEEMYHQTKDTLKFIKDFDGGIFSYKEKCVKPQEEIYNRLIKRYNIVPGESVFYDDRPENIETAEKLGIHGVVFTPATVNEILG